MFTRILGVAIITITLLGNRVMSEDSVQLEATRQKRDGYMSNTYGGTGSYGCSCPYQSCENGNEGILYFGAGALLGLFFSLLFPATMMMAAAAPAGGGGRRLSKYSKTDLDSNFNLPLLIGEEVAPLAIELLTVYSERSKKPECSRRWLCEITKNAVADDKFNVIKASLSRLAQSWGQKGFIPILDSIGDSANYDCQTLSPGCNEPYRKETLNP